MLLPFGKPGTRSLYPAFRSAGALALSKGGGASLARMLFGNGEDGFLFYPPSDLTRLFTTSVGPTNVAANDDPAGLWLDNHGWSGLGVEAASGAEKLGNADFDAGITNWAGSGATVSASSGTLRAVGGGAGNGAYNSDGFSVTSGKTYRVAMRVKGDGSYAALQLGLRRTSALGTFITTSATISVTTSYADLVYYFVAASSQTDACFFIRFSGTEAINVEWASVKEMPGNHALNATGTKRPLYKTNAPFPYLNFDGTDDCLGTPFVPTAALTLAAAFRNSAADIRIIGGGNAGESKRAFLSVDSSGKLSGGWGGHTLTTIVGGADTRDSAMHVGLITIDGTSVDLWLDGTQIYTGAPSGSGVGATSGQFYLGAGTTGAGNFINGRMSAALAVARRVTPAEIARITSDFQRTFQ